MFHIGSNAQSQNQGAKRKANAERTGRTVKAGRTVKYDNPRVNLLHHCNDVDPVYLAKRMKQSRIQHFIKPKTSAGEIAIIYPNQHKDNSLYTIVHTGMFYHKKTLVEWFIDNNERRFDSTQMIYGFSYISTMDYILFYNQKLRWAFKRLFLKWLVCRSLKNCIGLADIITSEPIPDVDKIRIVCLKSRCCYFFSGNVLLKSICSNLETQVNSLAVVVPPKNPFTNIMFGYGELLHIYNECLSWCGRRTVKFPAVLALYRDVNFKNHYFARVNNTCLQYKALQNYMINDDIDSSLFLETLSEIMKSNKSFLIVNQIGLRYIRIILFSHWIKRDPSHYLLKQWRAFITDYAFHAQTGIYPRDSWHTILNMLGDLRTLFQASIPHLL